MADNLISYVRLTKSYALTAVDVTSYSVLTNWTVDPALTINSQTATDLNITTPATAYSSYILTSPTFSPAISYDTNGTLFLVNVTVNYTSGSGDKIISLGWSYDGSTPVYPRTYTISPGSTDLSFHFRMTSGYVDKFIFQIIVLSAGAITLNFSNLSIDLANSDFTVNTNTFADWVSGSIIATYWRDTTNEIVAYLLYGFYLESSYQATTGPNLGPLTTSQVTDQHYQFCSGLDLIYFQFNYNSPDFPYTTKVTSVNDAACAISTPIVCDVMFSTPTVTYCTDASTSDGQVQLSASGSHGTIAYGYYPPSVIQGQFTNVSNTSGLFTGLSKGTYTFYAVDQYNCYDSISVYVGVSKTHSVKYRLQYYDIETNVHSVADIEERDYSGSPIYVIGTSDPVVISKTNGTLNNKFDTIRPTTATVNLVSERHFQYIGLYSQDDTKYLLSFTHGSYSWYGFLVPSTYSEDYSSSSNYEISLKFSCGLSSLSQYDFLDDNGNPIYVKRSLISVLSIILSKIGSDLNIISRVNKFASGMNTTSSDDPLYQTYIECLTFYSSDGTPDKCDVVLDKILKPLGCYIEQVNSKWHIIEVDQTASQAYREYDIDGVYVTNGTIDPVLSITNPSVNLTDIIFTGSHSLDIVPAYGKITITQELKIRQSLFPLSLSDWQKNLSGSGVATPYRTNDISNPVAINGMALGGLGSGYCTLLSPQFTVTAKSDSVKVSFKHAFGIKADGYRDRDRVNPPYSKIVWRLVLAETVSGDTYYYSEFLSRWSRDVSIGTSTTSIAIPTTHATVVTFTTQTGLRIKSGDTLKIQHDPTHYIRAQVTSYVSSTGVVTCNSFVNVGTGTYSGASAWTIYNAGLEYTDNWIFNEKSKYELQDFDTTITLPTYATATSVKLQLQITVYGETYSDFTNLATLQAITSATFPTGYRIFGTDPINSSYYRYFQLSDGDATDTSGTTASVVRPTDYNSTLNTVYWDGQYYYFQAGYFVPFVNTGGHGPSGVRAINSVHIQDVVVNYLPGGVDPISTAILGPTIINTNYKEDLTYPIACGDVPDVVTSPQIYTNIFTLSDGTYTTDWVRTDISNIGNIQDILLQSLGNQYNKPTWSLSGDFLAPNIYPDTIVKHTVNARGLLMTNTDLPTGTGWSQSGSGQSWVAGATYAYVDFSPSLTGNSQYNVQSHSIVESQRIKVSFSLQRLNSSLPRKDRLVCVLMNVGNIVQKVTITPDITTDGTMVNSFTFSSDAQADSIGYFIENVSGTGTCQYRLDYFTGVDVSVVRYYYVESFDRSDKHNLYKLKLIHLIPPIPSVDPTVDDSGDSNTTGVGDGVVGSSGGRAFNILQFSNAYN